jgi:hypothetical protein
MLILQGLISEVIPSQKYSMNVDPVADSYTAVARGGR